MVRTRLFQGLDGSSILLGAILIKEYDMKEECKKCGYLRDKLNLKGNNFRYYKCCSNDIKNCPAATK